MKLNKFNSTLSTNFDNKKNFHKTTISKKKNLVNYFNYKKNYLIDDRKYFIQRENEMLVSKIKKIAFRQNKLLEPDLGVIAYRKEKEKNLRSVRKLYKKSLDESNCFLKNKIVHSKSSLNFKKFFHDYIKTRKVYDNLRNIYPLNNFDYSLKHSKFQYKSLDELMNKSYKMKINKNYTYLPLIKIFPL